jgi:hypothetical protein
MYLTELDPKTGLVRVDGPFDGIMAIKEFRDVVNDESLGIKCFTSIALTVDYLTPIKYYREEDRPYKAMEIACDGERRAFIWDQELIQEALIKYDDLQYNATIEEKKALDFMLLEKLKEIKNESDNNQAYNLLDEITVLNIEAVLEENKDVKRLLMDQEWKHLSLVQKKSFIKRANQRIITPFNKKQKDRASEQSQEKVLNLFKQLNTIKSLIENFNRSNEEKDLFADGPVVNGYKLTRLEEKQLDKNSFYNKE